MKVFKKNAYEQRIREVEHASFTPLVLTATGGLANEATIFYKRLASLIAAKRNNPYNATLSWLRCRLSFSLLRSAIRCIRGAHSSCGHALYSPISLYLNQTWTPLFESLHVTPHYTSSPPLHSKPLLIIILLHITYQVEKKTQNLVRPSLINCWFEVLLPTHFSPISNSIFKPTLHV